MEFNSYFSGMENYPNYPINDQIPSSQSLKNKVLAQMKARNDNYFSNRPSLSQYIQDAEEKQRTNTAKQVALLESQKLLNKAASSKVAANTMKNIVEPGIDAAMLIEGGGLAKNAIKSGLKSMSKKAVTGLSNIEIKNIDDLLQMDSDKIEKLTGLDKDYWELMKNRYPAERVQRSLQSKLFSGNTHITSAPDLKDNSFADYIVDRSKKKQEDWLNSDEWLKRRINATGESEKDAIIAKNSMLDKLKNTKTLLKNIENYPTSSVGFATSENNNPIIYLGADKNLAGLKNTAQHELIHASNAWNPEYTMKGIPFKKIPYESEDASVRGVVDYLNIPAEQQVRGVQALNYLKDKNIWKKGEITDEMVNHLKRNAGFHGDVPNDVANLVSNFSKDDLKNFLNKVYVSVPAVVGAAKLKSMKKNEK
jgi:hypothetical protein